MAKDKRRTCLVLAVLGLLAVQSSSARAEDSGARVSSTDANIVVRGEVFKPGTYNFDDLKRDAARIGNNGIPLVGVIDLCGGIKSTANAHRITIIGARSKGAQFDLLKYLLDDTDTSWLCVGPGDVIDVPRANGEPEYHVLSNNPKVRIFGCVRCPGILKASASDGVASLVREAGGFLRDAQTHWVIIAKMEHDGTISATRKAMKDKTPLKENQLIVVVNRHNDSVNIPFMRSLLQKTIPTKG